MTSGRTVWQAQDAAWWRRERVVLLGEQFSAEGPAVANWLECEAKAQNAGGRVKTGYAAAARGAFLGGGAERAREIVAFAVEIGFLEDFEPGERTFRATIAAYASDQGTGKATARKQTQRDRDEEADAPRDIASETVTGRDTSDATATAHVLSRPVTPCHAPVSETGQERTGQEEDSSLRSSSSLSPPDGGEHERAGPGKVVSFDRRPVPASRLELAERILAEFNRQAGTSYSAYTGRGRPSEDLKRIIGTLTDLTDPPLEFNEASRMIAVRLANPFWSGPPHTGVVFGEKVRAASRTAAAQAGKGSVSSRELAERFNRPSGDAA